MNTRIAQRRTLPAMAACLLALAATQFALSGTVHAADVATVSLGTASSYSVLGGSAVTNTGSSTLELNLGVSPSAAISGFPPGIVNAPGVVHQNDAHAAEAQAALTAAYGNAAGRSVNETVTSNLGGLTLVGGVYAAAGHDELSITGTLTLDAGGNTDTVFIFQTNSTLITASSSSVQLINGAQACRVFWQVGSSATLGSSSTMVGSVMANASVTVGSGVTVYGRALARSGAVTLISDNFNSPSCAPLVGDTGGTGDTSGTVINDFPTTGAMSRGVLWAAIVGVTVGGAATWVAVRRRVPA